MSVLNTCTEFTFYEYVCGSFPMQKLYTQTCKCVLGGAHYKVVANWPNSLWDFYP